MYLNPDVLCPNEGKSGDWRLAGKDTEVPGFVREAKKSDLNVTIPAAKEAIEEGAPDHIVISLSNTKPFIL